MPYDQDPSFFRRHGTSLLGLGLVVVLVAGVFVFRQTWRTEPVDVAGTVRVDLTKPFTGTPAADWADGADGIVPPPPAPVGDHSAEAVARAYARVKQVLVTSRLDREVIVGGAPEKVLRLFAPDLRGHLRKSLADPALGDALVTRISPDHRLLPVEPKVNGRMWAGQDKDGQLLVHTKYVFAYAFHTDEPDELLDELDIVAMERIDTDYLVITDSRHPAAERGLWLGESKGFSYSMACTASQAGILAPLYSERSPATDPDVESPDHYFDPASPIPTKSCAR